MRILITGLVVTLSTTVHALDQAGFAALALKSGGAIVAECPNSILTKDQVLESGVTTGIYKVSTQSKINGSKQSAYAVNPTIKPTKRGCVYKAQKVDVTRGGSLTLKAQ